MENNNNNNNYNNKLNRNSFDIFNKNHKIFIEGHRGINKEKPENTKISFLKAIEYNLDSIELDIWLSKDLIPVIFHGGLDGNLISDFDVDGLIINYDYEFLMGLKSKKHNEKIPKLEEIFQICKNKIFINIEIKFIRIGNKISILLSLISILIKILFLHN